MPVGSQAERFIWLRKHRILFPIRLRQQKELVKFSLPSQRIFGKFNLSRDFLRSLKGKKVNPTRVHDVITPRWKFVPAAAIAKGGKKFSPELLQRTFASAVPREYIFPI